MLLILAFLTVIAVGTLLAALVALVVWAFKGRH